MYCFVRNNEIVLGPCPLPASWDTVSNLGHLTINQLREFGWYPVTSPTKPSIDPIYERINTTREIVAFSVEETHTVESLSEEAATTNLVLARQKAIDVVNRAAGVCRAKFMTNIPGQESTYLMKETEANRWLETENPVDDHYPILFAEATACGWTMEYTVQYVMTTAAMFRQLAATIEGKRRGAIIGIESATTSVAINALTYIDWP